MFINANKLDWSRCIQQIYANDSADRLKKKAYRAVKERCHRKLRKRTDRELLGLFAETVTQLIGHFAETVTQTSRHIEEAMGATANVRRRASW